MSLDLTCKSVFVAVLLFASVGCGQKFWPSLPVPAMKAKATPPPAIAPPPRVVDPALTAPDPVDKLESPLITNDPLPVVPAPEPALGEPMPPSEPMPPAEAKRELFTDSFSDFAGSIHWSRDGKKTGEGPPHQRTVYFFAGTPEGGPLVMKVLEDAETVGPDGQPGVLAMSWQEWPPKLPWSGFVYIGGGSRGRMELPTLRQAKTPEDLQGLRLKFSYKGVKADADTAVNIAIDPRLEPMLPESFNKRLDLGKITATSEWQTIEISLADAKNRDKFLAAITTENPQNFKIVFGQIGPLTSYHPGDTLLIDDIAVINTNVE